jgi:hypothetical protein
MTEEHSLFKTSSTPYQSHYTAEFLTKRVKKLPPFMEHSLFKTSSTPYQSHYTAEFLTKRVKKLPPFMEPEVGFTRVHDRSLSRTR